MYAHHMAWRRSITVLSYLLSQSLSSSSNQINPCMKEQCGNFIVNPRHKCKICVTNNLFLGINKIPWPAYFIRGFSIKSVDVNTKSTLDKVILNTVLPVYQDIHATNVKLVFVLLFCNIMTVSGEKYNTTLFIFGTEASRIVTSLVPDRRDQSWDYSVSRCHMPGSELGLFGKQMSYAGIRAGTIR